MQVNTCIRSMLATRPDTSGAAVSRALGHSDRWASVVGMSTRSPALATVADVADVLGYDLVVRDRRTGDDVGTIEAPRRAGAEDPPAGDEARG